MIKNVIRISEQSSCGSHLVFIAILGQTGQGEKRIQNFLFASNLGQTGQRKGGSLVFMANLGQTGQGEKRIQNFLLEV